MRSELPEVRGSQLGSINMNYYIRVRIAEEWSIRTFQPRDWWNQLIKNICLLHPLYLFLINWFHNNMSPEHSSTVHVYILYIIYYIIVSMIIHKIIIIDLFNTILTIYIILKNLARLTAKSWKWPPKRDTCVPTPTPRVSPPLLSYLRVVRLGPGCPH